MACGENILVIEVEAVWIKSDPNAIDECDCCDETIFSSIYTLAIYCEGKKLSEAYPPVKVCASCIEGTELRIL